jgi:hypothetical protein
MRKITRDAVEAFMSNRDFKRGNTWVQCAVGRRWFHLHGNVIAEITNNGELYICSQGWNTVTTKERLNGLPGVHIQQKDFQWLLNGEPWNGSLIRIS